MSVLVKCNKGKIEVFRKLYEKHTPSDVYFDNNEKLIVNGDFLDTRGIKELIKCDWINTPNILNTFEGAFSMLKVTTDGVYIACDMNGIDTLYYFINSETFIVSDNPWDIVKDIKPSMEMVSRDLIRCELFEGGAIDGSLLIKGLYALLPNHIAFYSFEKKSLDIRCFAEFRYSPIDTSLDKAVEDTDQLLHKAMESIKRKCGDVRYGIGISGGLDSRIISHYAKANEMDIVGFNICVSKPHHFLYARSIKSAKSIAKAFNIPFHIVEWKSKTIRQKIRKSIDASLYFNGSAFKIEKNGMPDFDVLLTGATGLIVGSQLPVNIESFNKFELVDSIFTLFGSYSGTTFSNRAKRAISYITGLKIGSSKKAKQTQRTKLGVILFGNNYEKDVRKKILGFVEERINKGFSNLDIYEDFFLNVCGYTNRIGAFESINGTKKSFSIYVPFLLEESLRWPIEFLKKRKLLNELINSKVPEVSNIKSESFDMSPKANNNKFGKITSMFDFLLRGNGTAIDQYYLSKRSMRKQFLEDINENKKDWFHKIFNINSDITKSTIRKEPVRLIARIWELYYLIEKIEKIYSLGEKN